MKNNPPTILVKDLKKLLDKFNDDLPVFVSGIEGLAFPIENIQGIDGVKPIHRQPRYGFTFEESEKPTAILID
jgi:hypothetical protein